MRIFVVFEFSRVKKSFHIITFDGESKKGPFWFWVLGQNPMEVRHSPFSCSLSLSLLIQWVLTYNGMSENIIWYHLTFLACLSRWEFTVFFGISLHNSAVPLPYRYRVWPSVTDRYHFSANITYRYWPSLLNNGE